MYEGAKTCVCTPGGNTEYFDVQVGLHQGSALCPFLFAIIMDVLTRDIQGDIPWCMLFADDIVLIGDSRAEVTSRLDVWRQALESKGFRISRSKTEYVEFNFGEVVQASTEVLIGEHIVPKMESFQYLGSVMQSDGGCDADITHRIQMGWLKWRSASGVLCDKKVPLRLKGFYVVAFPPFFRAYTEAFSRFSDRGTGVYILTTQTLLRQDIYWDVVVVVDALLSNLPLSIIHTILEHAPTL